MQQDKLVAHSILGEIKVNDVTLAEVAVVFKNDPTVDARLEGNVLFYTLSDGTAGKIVETIGQDGSRSLLTIEGWEETEIVIDQNAGVILLDNAPVVVTASENTVFVTRRVYRDRWGFEVLREDRFFANSARTQLQFTTRTISH